MLLLVISFSNDSAYAKTSETHSGVIQFSDHDAWRVGDEDIEIFLADMDLNRNPNSIETLSLVNAYDIIPITFEQDGEIRTNSQSGSLPLIAIGDVPFKLNLWNNGQVIFQNNQVPQRDAGKTAVFSINTDSSLNSGDSLLFKNAMGRFYDVGTVGSDLSNLAIYINYDISVIESNISSGKINSFSISLEDDTHSVLLVQSNKFKDFIRITPEKIAEIKSTLSSDTSLNVKFRFDNIEANTIIQKDANIPVIFDAMRMGHYGDGSQTNQYFFEYIVRPELVETGADTGIFKGKMSYQRLPTSKLSSFDYASLDREGNEVVVPVLPANDIEVHYFDHAEASGQTVEVGSSTGTIMPYSGTINITLQEDTKTVVDLAPEIFDGYFSTYRADSINNKVVYHNSSFGDLGTQNRKIEFQPLKDIFGKFNEQRIFIEYVFPSIQLYPSSIMINFVIAPTDDPITLGGMTIQSISLNEDSIVTIPIVNQCSTGMETIMNCKGKSDNLNEINILNNDLDTLSFVVVKSPEHLVVSGTNSLKLTPTKDFFGSDTMSIKLSDGKNESEELTLNVAINSQPDIPVANTGADQRVDVSSTVQLDGSQSNDVDGDTITYSWIQTAGYPVTLTDSKIANPKFTAPSEEGQITFMLTVSDGTATSNPNVINIYVGMPVPEPTAPPAPTSLTSTASSNSVTLAWASQDDGGSPITDYVLEYKTSDETEWTVYQDGVDDYTSMMVTDLKNNVGYDFRIYAINSVGNSELSQVISATISEQTFEPQTTEPDAEPTQETQRLESKKQQINEKIKEIKRLLALIKSRS